MQFQPRQEIETKNKPCLMLFQYFQSNPVMNPTLSRFNPWCCKRPRKLVQIHRLHPSPCARAVHNDVQLEWQHHQHPAHRLRPGKTRRDRKRIVKKCFGNRQLKQLLGVDVWLPEQCSLEIKHKRQRRHDMALQSR